MSTFGTTLLKYFVLHRPDCSEKKVSDFHILKFHLLFPSQRRNTRMSEFEWEPILDQSPDVYLHIFVIHYFKKEMWYSFLSL